MQPTWSRLFTGLIQISHRSKSLYTGRWFFSLTYFLLSHFILILALVINLCSICLFYRTCDCLIAPDPPQALSRSPSLHPLPSPAKTPPPALPLADTTSPLPQPPPSALPDQGLHGNDAVMSAKSQAKGESVEGPEGEGEAQW